MRGTENLIPEAQEAAQSFKAECERRGLQVLITDTLRTESEQNALYAQGRTKPGNIVTSCRYPQSLHNWGCAFDFCRNEKGREYENSDGFFEKCGAVAESLGLVWGGRFKTPDRPHIQLKAYAPDKTAAYLISKYKTPEVFLNEKREEDIMTDKDFKEALERALTPELAKEIVKEGIGELAKDGASESWEKEALLWAYERGIYKGDGRGNLMPKKPVSRAELAKALYNMQSEGIL